MRSATTPENLYLDLMKKCLTYSLWGESIERLHAREVQPLAKRLLLQAFQQLFKSNGWIAAQPFRFDPIVRAEGRDWPPPPLAHTMVGLKRLDNLQYCIDHVVRHDIPGDLIETGVWRGGSTIFMRAVLKALNDTNRTVWVADSFAGLPPPSPNRYPADEGDAHHRIATLAVSLDEVKANFAKYDLLDDQVRFLEGWFKDTLPTAPIRKLAVMRLDGDMYESTMDALTALYPLLSDGGFVIIDDYALDNCRAAVRDYRTKLGIDDPIREIDRTAVYWQREGRG